MLAWARNSAAWRISRKMMTERELSDAVSRKARQKFEDIPEEHVALLACAAVDFGRMAGAIDDANYAEVKTRSLTGSGRSRRMIARKLAEKGVGQELIAETLVDADDTDAAIIFARKRAFGPFRKVEPDQKRMTKELSAFARNGFSLALARHVLEMDRDEAEEQLLGRHRLL
nr:regulatory protein RecX [Rhizobium halophytocola]